MLGAAGLGGEAVDDGTILEKAIRLPLDQAFVVGAFDDGGTVSVVVTMYDRSKEVVGAFTAVRGQPLARGMSADERSARMADDAVMHTLAAVYADAGELSEARQTLLRGVKARGEAALWPHDGIVMGRLAERYGLPDVAIRFYCATRPDSSSGRLIVQAIAERRLAALGATCAGTGAARR